MRLCLKKKFLMGVHTLNVITFTSFHKVTEKMKWEKYIQIKVSVKIISCSLVFLLCFKLAIELIAVFVGCLFMWARIVLFILVGFCTLDVLDIYCMILNYLVLSDLNWLSRDQLYQPEVWKISIKMASVLDFYEPVGWKPSILMNPGVICF